MFWIFGVRRDMLNGMAKLSSFTRSPEETQALAETLGREIRETRTCFQACLLIGLFGDLGSGKTTFVKGLACGLGVAQESQVTSPTFTLIHEYGRLIHVDLYRLEKPEEVETLGLKDYFIPENIIAVEWPQKMKSLMKGFRMDFEVHFRWISGDEREIKILSTAEGKK